MKSRSNTFGGDMWASKVKLPKKSLQFLIVLTLSSVITLLPRHGPECLLANATPNNRETIE
ncbi:hypothetical protein DSO57_1008760 [Entomophthora muscae]|uniref:Uncharacterized protein n=1 Tax=Entomophthora muscae TaxID=34485 RepID=A0ACC2UGC4_9FUNG|nr:hypothetical protein DSO57_1008760 [Entomophthora muscae]